MKRKKRRPCSNGSRIVENHGLASEKQTHGQCSHEGNRMHILTVFDELDGYLSPKTPEIHRVRIPNCGGFSWGTSGFANGTNLNPKPCFDDGGFPNWDQKLMLSPEALKEPRQDFVEGFEKLLEIKFGIMALRIRHGLDAWSLGSHMVNPFEVVSYVAANSTLNRAFFKMWELIQTFELVPLVSKSRRFLSAHLCEGPGGFIEAVLEYRARSRSICDGLFEENHQENTLFEAVDHEELHSKPRGNCGSDHPSSLKLSNGVESSRCLSTTISNTSRAPHCGPKRCSSTEFDHGAGLKARLGSLRAAERSRAQSGNSTFISGPPGAKEMLENTSNTHSSARVHEILGRKFDRVDAMDVEDEFLDSHVYTVDLKEVEDDVLDTNVYRVDSRDVEDEFLDRNSDRVDSGDVEDEVLHRNLDKVDLRDIEDGVSDSSVDRVDSHVEDVSVGNTSINYHDLWFGVTLAATPQQCATGGSGSPMMEMTRLNEKVARLRASSQGHLHYGLDGSGDLTNPANVDAFVEYTLGQSDGQKMDLITADGAFDVSEDFSSQEHSHLHLVFCEVVAALRLQAEGGSFVLKLFDCYTASTLSILSILSSVYKNVEIVRLRTTRICNSERYVVAEGFLGLSPKLEKILLRLNEEWSMASTRGEKVGLLLSEGVSEQLLEAVLESNAAIAALQIDGINRALQLADLIGERLPPADNSFGKRKGSIALLRRKLQTHKRMQRNAVALCYALNVPCRPQFCVEKYQAFS